MLTFDVELQTIKKVRIEAKDSLELVEKVRKSYPDYKIVGWSRI